MALERLPVVSVAPAHRSGLVLLAGGRGHPSALVLSRADALTPVLEAIEICRDAIQTAHKIHNAELAGDMPSMRVLDLAAGLAHRAGNSRGEMLRLAAELDGGGEAA